MTNDEKVKYILDNFKWDETGKVPVRNDGYRGHYSGGAVKFTISQIKGCKLKLSYSALAYILLHKKYPSGHVRRKNIKVDDYTEDNIFYKGKCSYCMQLNKTFNKAVKRDIYRLPRNICDDCMTANNQQSKDRRQYGLSPDDIDSLFNTQNGRCIITGRELDGNFVVDHCKVTRNVYGLIGNDINKAIGLFGHNSEWLMKAAEYCKNRAVTK